MSMSLKNFFDFNFQTLREFLLADLKVEEKKTSMRAKQLWQAVYKKGLEELNHLTTLPVELRDELISKITLKKPKIADTQTSEDGTIKCNGERGHLFLDGKSLKNFEFETEVKTLEFANSGIFVLQTQD